MTGKSEDNNTVNHNIELLYKFNLSDKDSLKLFNESTRDIIDLKALKCIKSGVIVLEYFRIPEEHYEKNTHYSKERSLRKYNSSIGKIETNPSACINGPPTPQNTKSLLIKFKLNIKSEPNLSPDFSPAMIYISLSIIHIRQPKEISHAYLQGISFYPAQE